MRWKRGPELRVLYNKVRRSRVLRERLTYASFLVERDALLFTTQDSITAPLSIEIHLCGAQCPKGVQSASLPKVPDVPKVPTLERGD